MYFVLTKREKAAGLFPSPFPACSLFFCLGSREQDFRMSIKFRLADKLPLGLLLCFFSFFSRFLFFTGRMKLANICYEGNEPAGFFYFCKRSFGRALQKDFLGISFFISSFKLFLRNVLYYFDNYFANLKEIPWNRGFGCFLSLIILPPSPPLKS